jgi:Major royal jelly protein
MRLLTFASVALLCCAASAQQFGRYQTGQAPVPIRPYTQTSGFGPAQNTQSNGVRGSPVQQIGGWTYLNFAGINAERTVPENGVVTGIQVTPDRIFLTLPRSREGVPATLTYMPNNGVPVENQPLLPFPDWSWQQGHLDNCSGLVSVFRSRIDSCGRLWVLDSGVLTPLDGSPINSCPPRLVAFDLKTGLAIRSVTFPPQVRNYLNQRRNLLMLSWT